MIYSLLTFFLLGFLKFSDGAGVISSNLKQENRLVSPQTAQTGLFQKTRNAFGYQINQLDDFGTAFIESAKTAVRPVADLGVAYGFSTLRLLEETSALVIANDISEEHLRHLSENVTDEQQLRLTIMPGDALDLQILEGSLDGILALRWLHFLRPKQIRTAFNKFSNWLAPGGKLCITVATPYLGKCAEFLPIYLARKSRREEWPGYMAQENVCWKEASNLDHGYLFDVDVLQREASLAGFQIDRCSYVSRDIFHGKENVGLLATKL